MNFLRVLFDLFYTGDLPNAFYVEGEKYTTPDQTPKTNVMGSPSSAYDLVFTEFYEKDYFLN